MKIGQKSGTEAEERSVQRIGWLPAVWQRVFGDWGGYRTTGNERGREATSARVRSRRGL